MKMRYDVEALRTEGMWTGMIHLYSIRGMVYGSIPKITVSTQNDECYNVLSLDIELAKVIYNGIIDYSFEESKIDLTKLDVFQTNRKINSFMHWKLFMMQIVVVQLHGTALQILHPRQS